MVISTQARGPSYSTDEAARALHATFARTTIVHGVERGETVSIRAEDRPHSLDLQRLYPALFVVSHPSARAIFATSIAHAFGSFRRNPQRAKG